MYIIVYTECSHYTTCLSYICVNIVAILQQACPIRVWPLYNMPVPSSSDTPNILLRYASLCTVGNLAARKIS